MDSLNLGLRAIEKLAKQLKGGVPSCLIASDLDLADVDISAVPSCGGCSDMYRCDHPVKGKLRIKMPHILPSKPPKLSVVLSSYVSELIPLKDHDLCEWMAALRLRHPNIIPFFGIVQMRGVWGGVFPEVEYGSILQYVKEKPPADCDRLTLVCALLSLTRPN